MYVCIIWYVCIVYVCMCVCVCLKVVCYPYARAQLCNQARGIPGVLSGHYVEVQG